MNQHPTSDSLPPNEGDAAAPEDERRFSRPVRWLLLAVLWLGVSAVFALQISAIGLVPSSAALAFALIDWGPWIVFSPFVLFLARRLPIGPKTWKWALPLHLLSCLVVVALMETAMSALSWRKDLIARPIIVRHRVAAEGQGENDLPRPPPPPRMRFRGADDPVRFAWFRFSDRARIAVPVYWMLVAAAHAVAQHRRGIERERRVLRAEAHLAEARLMALQAQLNPHFLFNTLNTIAHLVYDNPEAAEEMITSLSEMLRAVLAAQKRREVSLDEELAFLDRYCAIQKVRFADRLSVRFEIEPAARSAAVPALLLQPLVENAVLHGVTPERGAGEVFIRARVEADRLRLEVADTGSAPEGAIEEAGLSLQFDEGVGLGNTRARLAALYGDRSVFTLSRAAEGGVSARIEIPLRHLAA